MKKVFDLLAILSGVIGLGWLLLQMGDLTAENAVIQGARAMMVMASVVVPFVVARAMEKFSLSLPLPRIMPPRTRPTTPAAKASKPTTYFDYFFQPGSADDWRSTHVAALQNRRNSDDVRGVEM